MSVQGQDQRQRTCARRRCEMADRRGWLDGESVATIADSVRGSPERVDEPFTARQRVAPADAEQASVGHLLARRTAPVCKPRPVMSLPLFSPWVLENAARFMELPGPFGLGLIGGVLVALPVK